jgi:glycyl-tRNA synthetase beta chain
MVKDCLLEIYCEELPVKYIVSAIDQINQLTVKYLNEYKLNYKDIKVYATPRRLVLYINGIKEETEQQKEEIIGPSIKNAFNENNEPTKSALGFARTHGVDIKDLTIKETSKGKYVSIVKIYPGIKTEKILHEIFIKIITNIIFPKTMVWEKSKFRFARPIRNILAIYGDKIVKFSIADIKSCNYTYGINTLSLKKIKINSPEKYISTLRNNYVLVDHQFRLETINKIISESTRKISKLTSKECRCICNQELITEINFLVEHPVAIICKLPEKLSLPKEIIIHCMQKKHKFLPVVDSENEITEYFIGIRNGISENQDIVKKGYEKVITATLEDAQFFYNQDTKTTLESKIDKLKKIVFHDKLGSMYDKVQRIKKISEYIASTITTNENLDIMMYLSRIVNLCKADLVTDIVYEYPELEGIAGRIYAEHDNEPEKISKVIEEHYYPLTSDGQLPSTELGTIISIADKIDTIVSDFTIGLIPTGSADPYGLRRKAIGILRMIRENKLDISLRKLIEISIELLPQELINNKSMMINEIIDFMSQRLEIILESEGYKTDEIKTILANGLDNIVDIDEKIKALKNIRNNPEFTSLITGFKRAANIIKQAEKNKLVVVLNDIDEKKFVQNEEKILYTNYSNLKTEIQVLIESRKYSDILIKLTTLHTSIDNFFNKVMVMTPDESVCKNRLTLLKNIVNLFTAFGDFSLLQT